MFPRARVTYVCVVVMPDGERIATITRAGPGLPLSAPWTLTTGVVHVPGPEQVSEGITPRPECTTGPCGMSVTGRVIPPQFHQPSRGSACLRLTTRSTCSLTRPGRSPRAGSVNGEYGSSWEPICLPLSHTVA